MVSTKVTMPDGSEEASSEIICEGCDKPISEHSCGSTFTVSSGAAAGGSAFKTGPRRKDPTTGPLCPHCQGRLHSNMLALLQNTECLARQMYVDKGVIATPFTTLPKGEPLAVLDEIVTWSKTLASPATSATMETPAGTAGTYASIKKNDPDKPVRAKKQKAAEAGERIEDIAATVAPVATDTANGTEKKRRRQRPEAPVAVAEPAGPTAEEIEALRAQRRAILLGR